MLSTITLVKIFAGTRIDTKASQCCRAGLKTVNLEILMVLTFRKHCRLLCFSAYMIAFFIPLLMCVYIYMYILKLVYDKLDKVRLGY